MNNWLKQLLKGLGAVTAAGGLNNNVSYTTPGFNPNASMPALGGRVANTTNAIPDKNALSIYRTPPFIPNNPSGGSGTTTTTPVPLTITSPTDTAPTTGVVNTVNARQDISPYYQANSLGGAYAVNNDINNYIQATQQLGRLQNERYDTGKIDDAGNPIYAQGRGNANSRLASVGNTLLTLFSNMRVDPRANNQQQLFNLLGTLGAGTVAGLVKPNSDEMLAWQQEQQRAQALRNSSLAAIDTTSKINERLVDVESKAIANNFSMNTARSKEMAVDPVWVQANETKILTPEMAQYLSQKYGTYISPAAWQEWISTEVGGTTFMRQKTSPTWVPSNIEPDKTQMPIKVEVGGMPVYTTNDKAFKAAVDREQNIYKAGIDMQRDKNKAAAQRELENLKAKIAELAARRNSSLKRGDEKYANDLKRELEKEMAAYKLVLDKVQKDFDMERDKEFEKWASENNLN